MSSCRRAVVPIFQFLAILLVTLSVVSCGGSSSLKSVNPPSDTAVSINPASITVTAGQKQQLIATVTGSSSNDAVIWTVSGPGTVSSSGLYTAPASVSCDHGDRDRHECGDSQRASLLQNQTFRADDYDLSDQRHDDCRIDGTVLR